MSIRHVFVGGLLAASGLASAVALTMPGVAKAWDINNLPPGFSITAGQFCVPTPVETADECTNYTIFAPNGQSEDLGSPAPQDNSGSTTAFDDRLNAFVDENLPPVTTATTTTEATTTDQTTTSSPPAGSQPVTTDQTSTLQTQITALQAEVAALQAQLAALEQAFTNAGFSVGFQIRAGISSGGVI